MTQEPEVLARLRTANAAYADQFGAAGVPGRAGQRLLLITCMDSRIVPHAVFGLREGDMKVIRNAGGQLNPEVVNDIVLASHVLDCECIVIMPHTKCAMAIQKLDGLRSALSAKSGKDFSSFEPRLIDEPTAKLSRDVAELEAHPLLHEAATVHGAMYDVDTGRVNWL
jgi:carbonic anhydrase